MDAETRGFDGGSVKQAKTSKHPWLVACDANKEPEDVQRSLWYKRHVHVEGSARRGNLLCRSKGPHGESIELTYDDVIDSQSTQDKIKGMEVVEDFESRPHKAMTFLVERDKEILSEFVCKHCVRWDFFRFLFLIVTVLNRRHLLSPESVAPALQWRTNRIRKRSSPWKRRHSSRCPRGSQRQRLLSVSGTELRHRQKQRHHRKTTWLCPPSARR